MDSTTFEYFKKNTEINYFTYFINCYLALNAYMKNKFDGNGREKINKLKECSESQKRFFELFDNQIFIDSMKEFKKKLYESQIKNKDIISFDKVEISPLRPKEIPPFTKHGITYELKILGGENTKISFICKRYKESIGKTCEYANIAETLNKTKLTLTQRRIIESVFKKCIDEYYQNLNEKIENIARTSSDEDKKLIYQGFIEIIYQLRNALLHSKINPEQHSVCKVYELAYTMLKEFIYKLQIQENR